MSLFRFTNMLKCKKDETFKMEQSVSMSDFPMHMDAEYINTVQPRGFFRYWYRANQGGGDDFNLEMSISFLENGVEYHNFGESRTLEYKDVELKKGMEDITMRRRTAPRIEKEVHEAASRRETARREWEAETTWTEPTCL